MKLKNLTLPYDVYSRHTTVSRLIKNSALILDVGGCLRQLNDFLSNSIQVFSTDVVGGDVTFDGKHLPFKANSVEVVVSIDTIEHIHKKNRLNFIKELARVAKNQVILSAPLGTDSHILAEKKQLSLQKHKTKFLQEHVKFGLPQLSEIKQMLKIYPNHRLIFSGNHYLNSALFDFHASEIKLPVIGRIYYQLKKLLNVIFNLILYPIYKDLPLSQNTNRIYIVIKL